MKWLLIAAGLIAAYWLLWRPATPIYYRAQHQADLPPFIQSLFALLAIGSVIHLAHEGSARRLRLRKIYLPDGQHGVRLELPAIPAVSEHAEHVRARLEAGGFTVDGAAAMERLWPAQDPSLLTVDNLDALAAFRAVEVAREEMGLDADARYTIHSEGPPSLKAGREYRARRYGGSAA